MGKHQSVEMEFEGRKVQIDEMLVPLMEEVWRAGVGTEECCQGDPGERVFVYFPHQNDFLRFMNICGEPSTWNDMGSLYRRMHPPDDGVPDQWDYMIDLNDRHIAEKWKRTSQFYMGIFLWFPQEDIPLVIDRFRRYNERYKR